MVWARVMTSSGMVWVQYHVLVVFNLSLFCGLISFHMKDPVVLANHSVTCPRVCDISLLVFSSGQFTHQPRAQGLLRTADVCVRIRLRSSQKECRIHITFSL